MPHHYANSPLLTLDEAIIGQPTSSVISPQGSSADHYFPKSSVPTCNIQTEPITVPTCTYANFSQKKYSPKALGNSCREILSEIRQLTFLMDDREELENLKAELQGIRQRFKNVAPSDGGLQVERGNPNQRKKAAKLIIPTKNCMKFQRSGLKNTSTVDVIVLRQQ